MHIIKQLLLICEGTPYQCSDGHAVITNSNWTFSCLPTDEVVFYSSLIINYTLPDILVSSKLTSIYSFEDHKIDVKIILSER